MTEPYNLLQNCNTLTRFLSIFSYIVAYLIKTTAGNEAIGCLKCKYRLGLSSKISISGVQCLEPDLKQLTKPENTAISG